jgi:hypothetical protein
MRGESNTNKAITKANFKTFSMNDSERNYFLRNDRVLAVFQIDTTFQKQRIALHSLDELTELDLEKSRDSNVALFEKFTCEERKRSANQDRIDVVVEKIWSSLVRGSVVVSDPKGVVHSEEPSSSFKPRQRPKLFTPFSPPSTMTLPTFNVSNSSSSYYSNKSVLRDTSGDGQIELGDIFSDMSEVRQVN